jgi:hypothetical protein
MSVSDPFNGYLGVLEIRRSAYRRNMILAGGLFVMAFILTIGVGLVTGWEQRGIYIMAVFNVLFLIGYLMAWTRHEVVKQEIELLDNLRYLDRADD